MATSSAATGGGESSQSLAFPGGTRVEHGPSGSLAIWYDGSTDGEAWTVVARYHPLELEWFGGRQCRVWRTALLRLRPGMVPEQPDAWLHAELVPLYVGRGELEDTVLVAGLRRVAQVEEEAREHLASARFLRGEGMAPRRAQIAQERRGARKAIPTLTEAATGLLRSLGHHGDDPEGVQAVSLAEAVIAVEEALVAAEERWR